MIPGKEIGRLFLGPKLHRESVTDSPAMYVVRVGGTMDGLNTRGPIGYRVFDQVFEPNIEVSITNAGETIVRNPWLKIDGRGGWQTVQDMVSQATSGLKTDAEKTRALFEFERKHRFHASTYDRELRDVVKALNCYGYTLCFDDSKCLAQLWRAAGLKTRRGWPYGHSDEHCIYLLRDNKTIAGEADIVRDHDLIKRMHTYGPLFGDKRNVDEGSAALFYYEGPRRGDWAEKCRHRMHFELRPGEKIVWRWSNRKRYHGLEDIGKWRKSWTKICNGYFEYAPDLSKPAHRKHLLLANLRASSGQPPLWRALDATKPGIVEIPVRSAWPIVGGWVEVKADALPGVLRIEIAKNGADPFTTVWTNGEAVQSNRPVRIDLDDQFPPTKCIPLIAPTRICDPSRYAARYRWRGWRCRPWPAARTTSCTPTTAQRETC